MAGVPATGAICFRRGFDREATRTTSSLMDSYSTTSPALTTLPRLRHGWGSLLPRRPSRHSCLQLAGPVKWFLGPSKNTTDSVKWDSQQLPFSPTLTSCAATSIFSCSVLCTITSELLAVVSALPCPDISLRIYQTQLMCICRRSTAKTGGRSTQSGG